MYRTAALTADAETEKTALSEAQSACDDAQSALESARDALNAAVGNDPGTVLAVTGELSRDSAPSEGEEAAVKAALAARNEIKAADRTLAQAQQTLSELRYQVPVTAPEYLSQQAAVQTARSDAARARSDVEADVRERFAALSKLSGELDGLERELSASGTAAPKIDYAPRSGEGVHTLAELTEQWAQIETRREQQLSDTAQWDQAVREFGFAVGAGCTAAEI